MADRLCRNCLYAIEENGRAHCVLNEKDVKLNHKCDDFENREEAENGQT